MKEDIRWIQRYNNFMKAFSRLSDALELASERDLTDLENQGLIQTFEFTHELAWKTLKDFLENRGHRDIYGSKDATRLAIQLGLIENGEGWMDMIQSRNQSVHTYNEEIAEEIVRKISEWYYFDFNRLKEKLQAEKAKEESND